MRLLGWGIRFFLAAALTAPQLPGGYAPFALGWTAAAGPGGDGIAALLGTGVGLALFLDFGSALPHLAAAILICTAATALRGLAVTEKKWFPALCSGGIFLAVKGIYVLQAADPMAQVFPCLTAGVLVGLSARGYGLLLSPEGEHPEGGAVLFLAVTLLSSLTGAAVGPVDVGRTAILVLVLAASWQRGLAAGAATGLGAGLLMDLCAGTGSFCFSAAWGLTGLLAGTRTGHRRIGAAGLSLCAAAAVLLPMTDPAGESLLAETLCASAIFLLIPGRAFGGKRLQRPEPLPVPAAAEGLRERLSKTAAAFHDLYDSLGRGVARNQEENPAVVFDRAAEKVCRDCALCGLCWKKEYVATFNALNDATPFLLERGRALPKDFPGHFSDRCIHLPEFLTAVNGELSAFLLRRQYRRELEETRRSARGQYAQLGELLSATAAGLGETRAVAGMLRRPYRIGAALRPKEGEHVCGDSVASFETEGGRLCLLLSDGCGSGEAARRESAMTNRLLRQFLEAGIEPEAALKTLNAALALRSEETGSFATIDLLCLDLAGGEASLFKYGAAPTYLKKSGNVRRVTGGTLPAGLRESPAAPDVTRFPLEPGSFAVMISDGVSDAAHDEWLQNLLAGWEGEDPQTLAALVVQEAVRRGDQKDDCGVQVLFLPSEPHGKKAV